MLFLRNVSSHSHHLGWKKGHCTNAQDTNVHVSAPKFLLVKLFLPAYSFKAWHQAFPSCLFVFNGLLYLNDRTIAVTKLKVLKNISWFSSNLIKFKHSLDFSALWPPQRHRRRTAGVEEAHTKMG